MDMPAKPIIEPIERSNSPAIMSRAAPVAMMPNCAMIERLFLIPSALNALPSEAKAIRRITTTMTTNAPASGRRRSRRKADSRARRSDSLRPTVSAAVSATLCAPSLSSVGRGGGPVAGPPPSCRAGS